MTGLELVLTLLAVLIFVLILTAIIYVQWWRRKFRQEHSDVGSVTGHSTHSTPSKEMMYFMCWENSSQVAALGLPMSPAGTKKDRPPAFVGVDKHQPPAFVGVDKHQAPAFVGVDKHPPPAIVGVDRHQPPAFVGVDRHPPPASPPSPPSPPLVPMKLPVQERMDLPRKPQAATRDADRKPAPIPQGYNFLDKVYPNENAAFFTNKEVLDDGERRRSSGAAGNVFRQPSAELVFTTPAQSPPFYTPLSSPLRTIEGQLSNLHTSSSLPSSKDVVERLYRKKVVFKDTHHVKITVG